MFPQSCLDDKPSDTAMFDHHWENETFDQLDRTGWSYHTCVFQGCTFYGCTFDGARFENCRFIQCSFQRCFVVEADFVWVRMIECTGDSNIFSRSRFQNFSFFQCTFRYDAFANTSWITMDVRRSTLADEYFQNSFFVSCKFRTTDLCRTDFRGTRLFGLDFTTCRIYGIKISPSLKELRGLRITPEQASTVMRMIGVRIGRPKDRLYDYKFRLC